MRKKIKLEGIKVESFITNKRADLVRGASGEVCTAGPICTGGLFCNTRANCSDPCTLLCPPLP